MLKSCLQYKLSIPFTHGVQPHKMYKLTGLPRKFELRFFEMIAYLK